MKKSFNLRIEEEELKGLKSMALDENMTTSDLIMNLIYLGLVRKEIKLPSPILDKVSLNGK